MTLLNRYAIGDTNYVAKLNADAQTIERLAAPEVIDVEAAGGTVSLAYDPTKMYRITATADSTIELTGWPDAGVAAAQELRAIDWDAYAITLPQWRWGDDGIPDPWPSDMRFILRTDDGTTVDAMRAWSLT